MLRFEIPNGRPIASGRDWFSGPGNDKVLSKLSQGKMVPSRKMEAPNEIIHFAVVEHNKLSLRSLRAREAAKKEGE